MKNEILHTSLRQFLKYGIREMSIQKLVEPLGISTKTVYKYFKNKEQLLEESLHLYHTQQYQKLENLPTTNQASLFFDLWRRAVELEYNVNNAFFHDLHRYYPDLGRKIELAISIKFKKKFLLIIQRGIDGGVFRKDIIPEIVLEGILELYTAIVRTKTLKDFGENSYDVLLNTIALIIRGICTEKGCAEIKGHIQNPKTFKRIKVLSARNSVG